MCFINTYYNFASDKSMKRKQRDGSILNVECLRVKDDTNLWVGLILKIKIGRHCHVPEMVYDTALACYWCMHYECIHSGINVTPLPKAHTERVQNGSCCSTN